MRTATTTAAVLLSILLAALLTACVADDAPMPATTVEAVSQPDTPAPGDVPGAYPLTAEEACKSFCYDLRDQTATSAINVGACYDLCTNYWPASCDDRPSAIPTGPRAATAPLPHGGA